MNKDIHILFGLRIKELRVRAHISQEELSFRSGLSKNYISDVERGTSCLLYTSDAADE